MNDDEIIEILRAARTTRSPHEIAVLLGELRSRAITQSEMVTFFKRAFPAIPLRVLLDAGAWHRVSEGGMSDEEFDTLLKPYLGDG